MSNLIETLTSESQFELGDNRNYSSTFWDSFFRKRRKKFEWFCEFSDVACLFSEIFNPKSSSVLHIGCGNSAFPRDMVSNGWTNVTAIDFSECVIQQMIEIGPQDYLTNKSLTYKQMDAMRLCEHFGENSFDFVTEKGVVDDLVRDSEPNTRLKCIKMISQALQVLKPGGCFVMISMCRSHMLSFVAEAIVESIGCAESAHFYPILASEQAMATVLPFLIVITSSNVSTHLNGDASDGVEVASGLFAKEVGVHTLPVIDGRISDVNAHKEYIRVSSMDELMLILSRVSEKMTNFLYRNAADQSQSSPSMTSSPLTSAKTKSISKNEGGATHELACYQKSFQIEIALREVDFDPERFWNEVCFDHDTAGFASISELKEYTVIPIGFGIDLFRISGLVSIDFDETFDGNVNADGKVKYDGFLNEFVEMVQSWDSVQSCVTVI